MNVDGHVTPDSRRDALDLLSTQLGAGAGNTEVCCRMPLSTASGTPLATTSPLVGVAGFEPTAPRSQSECATKLRHTPSTAV